MRWWRRLFGAKDTQKSSSSDGGGECLTIAGVRERAGRTDMLPHNASDKFRSFYNEACALHREGKYAEAEKAFTRALNADGATAPERMLAAYARAKSSQARGGAVVIPTEFQANPEVCGNVFVAVTVASHLVRDGHRAVAWGKDVWNVAAQVEGNSYHLTFRSLLGAFMNSGNWFSGRKKVGLHEAVESAGKNSPHAYVSDLFHDVTRSGDPISLPEPCTGDQPALACTACGKGITVAWHCRKCDRVYCADCAVPATGSPRLREFFTRQRVHMLDLTDDGARPMCPKCGSNLGRKGEIPGSGSQPRGGAEEHSPRSDWTLQQYAQAIAEKVTNTTPCQESGLEEHGAYIRTLGEEISGKWGFSAMQEVWHAIHRAMGPGPCSDLTRIWDGVGEWQK